MPNEPEAVPQPDAGADLPTVSAVIPAYNAAETIERALNSVYAQTYPNIIEVIVVDDGSQDATAQIVRERFPEVTVIQQENAGAGAARNRGIAAARGELIAFLDSDDEWLAEKTERQVEMLRRHPGIDVLLCGSRVIRGGRDEGVMGPDPRGQARLTPLTFGQWAGSAPRESLHFGCSVWLIAARVFAHTGGFDPSVTSGQDWEYLLRCAGRGHSIWLLREVLVNYHIREGSLSRGIGEHTRPVDMTRVVEPYSPEGEGWQSDLLSPTEFRRVVSGRYWTAAWLLWRHGRRAEAREFLARSLSHSDARGMARLRRSLECRFPSVFYPLVRPKHVAQQVRDRLLGRRR